MTPDQVQKAMTELQPVPTTKARERQAARAQLESRVQTEVGRILAKHDINPKGYDLDQKRLGKTNFVVVKSEIDRQIMNLVGKSTGKRHELTRDELATIDASLQLIIDNVTKGIFNG